MKKLIRRTMITSTLFAIALTFAQAQELDVWVRSPALEPAFEAFNERMEEQGRDLRVNFSLIDPDDFPARFTTALAGGAAPDVVSIDLVLVPYYNSIGAFTELTENIESLEYSDTLNEAMLRLGTWNDELYAVPFAADVSALIYNRTMFEEAGLDPDDPPSTWGELVEAAEVLTGDGVYGYGFSGGNASGLMFTMMPYAWASGGRWVSDDGTMAELDHPVTVEAVEMFTNMINEYEVTPPGTATYSYSDFQDGFKQNRIAMISTGNFVVSDLTRNHPDIDFGVAPIPGREEGEISAFIGGDLIAVPDDSEHKDAAWEFIEFLLSPEVQVEVFARSGIIPVRSDLHDNEYFREEPRYLTFAEASRHGRVPFTTVYNELYDPFLEGLQKAFRETVPVEAALQEANQQMQEILDRAQ
ncbi:MAG: ABC transporter substrate-binding protein [Trueperaceae bacterium]|nr:ABC transporter substrate-binding protein [Trueperaceae bacterium]